MSDHQPPSVDQFSFGRRILIVDDNEESAETMALLLGLKGNHVEKARDGFEALEAVHRFDPHVVLLDISLPKMDGYQVCEAIRSKESASKTIMIALTGWGEEGDRLKSMQAGFDDHLVKPVSVDDVMEVLTRLAEQAASG